MAIGNKGHEQVAPVGANREWICFDQLPKRVRQFCSEGLLFDYSSEQLLEVWEECGRRELVFRQRMKMSDQIVVRQK